LERDPSLRLPEAAVVAYAPKLQRDREVVLVVVASSR